jgi:hypothetical protein
MIPDEPVLVSMPVSHIVTFWRVGSHDHSWADEFAELMRPDNETTQAILDRVDSEGIDFADDYAPVMLGSDGRVWDGHHRICIAIQRRTPSLMCEVVKASTGGAE